jgi:hypothetical protein
MKDEKRKRQSREEYRRISQLFVYLCQIFERTISRREKKKRGKRQERRKNEGRRKEERSEVSAGILND